MKAKSKLFKYSKECPGCGLASGWEIREKHFPQFSIARSIIRALSEERGGALGLLRGKTLRLWGREQVPSDFGQPHRESEEP